MMGAYKSSLLMTIYRYSVHDRGFYLQIRGLALIGIWVFIRINMVHHYIYSSRTKISGKCIHYKVLHVLSLLNLD